MSRDTTTARKPLRTAQENAAGLAVSKIFDTSTDPTEIKLEQFPKYVRRAHLKRFLVLYELFKRVLPVKGSVVECGVFKGFGLMTWAKLSAILEPENLTRRIYGFDTFDGFPSTTEHDQSALATTRRGDLNGGSYDELQALIEQYDQDRYLGHLSKVQLVRGDLASTAPAFIQANPHVLVSLLFIDCDLYEPTRVALETFVPRMPKGAILAFDELDNPSWPGETLAALEGHHGLGRLRIQRLDWDPYIGFVVIE